MQFRQTSNLANGGIATSELHEYAESVGGLWDLEFDQLSSSSDRTGCIYLTDGDAILYEEFFGATHLQRGCLSGCGIVFAIPDPVAQSGRWQGEECPSSPLAYARSGESLDLLIPSLSRIRVAILPLENFLKQFELLSGLEPHRVLPRGRLFLRLPPATLAGLWNSWGRLLRADKAGIRLESLADLLTEQIADCLIPASEPAGIDNRAVWRNFRRMTNHVEGEGIPASPGKLALDLGMSLRTLNDACRQCAGISPGRFLKLQRMNRVHRLLAQHEPGERTVTSIAMDVGFLELGRFAGEYRQLFGESPSETLRHRRSGAKVIRLGRL